MMLASSIPKAIKPLRFSLIVTNNSTSKFSSYDGGQIFFNKDLVCIHQKKKKKKLCVKGLGSKESTDSIFQKQKDNECTRFWFSVLLLFKF